MTGRARTKRGTALAAVLALIAGLLGAVAVEDSAYAAKVPGPPTAVTGVAGPGVGVMTLSWGVPANLAPNAGVNYYFSVKADNGAFSGLFHIGKGKNAMLGCNAVTACTFRLYANTRAAGPGARDDHRAVHCTVAARPAERARRALARPHDARSWNPSTNTGGKAINAYLYDVQVDSTGAWLGPFTLSGTPSTIQMPCSSTNPNGGCNSRVYARNVIGTSTPSTPLAAAWLAPSAPVINSVTPGKPTHAATINWKPGVSTGGLTNTYTSEVSADAGPFVPGAGPLPVSPTIATVECNAVTICSYRLKATSAKGAARTRTR